MPLLIYAMFEADPNSTQGKAEAAGFLFAMIGAGALCLAVVMLIAIVWKDFEDNRKKKED